MTDRKPLQIPQDLIEKCPKPLFADPENENSLKHDWTLIEHGYSCYWNSIDIDTDNHEIVAGNSEFDESGDGEYLTCNGCNQDRSVPSNYKIIWN